MHANPAAGGEFRGDSQLGECNSVISWKGIFVVVRVSFLESAAMLVDELFNGWDHQEIPAIRRTRPHQPSVREADYQRIRMVVARGIGRALSEPRYRIGT